MFSLISIEFDNYSIKIIEGIKKRNSLLILKCLSVELPEYTIEDGKIKNIGIVKQLLESALKDNNIKTKNALFLINSNSVISRKIDLPFMNRKKDTSLMIHYNIEEMFPGNTKQYVFTYKLSEIFMKEKVKYSSYIIQGLPVQVYSQYIDLAKGLKLEIIKLDISSNCLENLWTTQFPLFQGEQNLESVTAFVNVHKFGFCFSVLNHGINEFFRIYYADENKKVEMVAEDYDVYSFIPFNENDEIIKSSNVASLYSSIISKYIKYYYSINKGKEEISKIFVYGDECSTEDATALKLKLDMNVGLIKGLSNVAFDNDFVKQGYDDGIFLNSSLAYFDKRNKTNFLSKMQKNHKIRFNIGLAMTSALVIFAIMLAFKGINSLYKSIIIENELKAMRLFVEDEENIKLNAEIEEKIKKVEKFRGYVKHADKASKIILKEDLVDSELLRRIFDSVPMNTEVSSVSIDKNSIIIVCSSTEMNEISAFMKNLRNKEFISEIYVPEIEIKSEGEGIYYLYRILCKVEKNEN